MKASDPEALKDPKGKPIIRPYTPVSPPDAPGVLSLLVKRYESGNMSKYIHTLKVLAFCNPLLFLSPHSNRKEIPSLLKVLCQNSLTKVCLASIPVSYLYPNPASSQRIRRGCLDRRGQWHVSLMPSIPNHTLIPYSTARPSTSSSLMRSETRTTRQNSSFSTRTSPRRIFFSARNSMN